MPAHSLFSPGNSPEPLYHAIFSVTISSKKNSRTKVKRSSLPENFPGSEYGKRCSYALLECSELRHTCQLLLLEIHRKTTYCNKLSVCQFIISHHIEKSKGLRCIFDVILHDYASAAVWNSWSAVQGDIY